MNAAAFETKPDLSSFFTLSIGVFNVSGSPIPTSVLLGPYTGAVIAKKDYKKESGYGWEIRDGDKNKPVAIVDPGPNPDPNAHILAMVNSILNFKVVLF